MKHSLSALRVIVAVCLVISLSIPIQAHASQIGNTIPRASYYLDSYNTYICTMGSGKLEIWFEVMGTGDMDELGTLSIKLYESSNNSSWTLVKTFLHENYASMLAEDDYFYCSYVPYQGTAGKYYKAYVCIWAGRNGSGDTRYLWTPVERAS